MRPSPGMRGERHVSSRMWRKLDDHNLVLPEERQDVIDPVTLVLHSRNIE